MTNEFEKVFEEIIASQKVRFIPSDKSLPEQAWGFKQDEKNAAITKSYFILAYKAGMDRAKEVATGPCEKRQTTLMREMRVIAGEEIAKAIQSEKEKLFQP